VSDHWDQSKVPPLDGKVALVTGANAGLGLAATTMFARAGARVLLACRNQEKAQAAMDGIRTEVGPSADLAFVRLDLASLDSIQEAAAAVQSTEDRLDLLINNAGLMAVDESRTEDGFETQFGVNHLGHFALTAHLAPLVLDTPDSRIVTQSSLGHRAGRLRLDDLYLENRGYDRWRPYFQSKLANLLFTLELQRRLSEARATTMALAAHPGNSATEIALHGGGTGLAQRTMTFMGTWVQPYVPLAQSPSMGALPLVRAATDPGARGGQFYGPQWLIGGYPRVETPSRRARQADDARRLWDRSEELTGITFRPTVSAP
jgi:protochlorophyllide reductase